MYPINLDIENKKCVVVGGGKVAFRKIRGLLEAGAKVEVISPEFCNEIEELFNAGKIFLRREKYSPEKISDAVILIAATNNKKINDLAIKDAEDKKILANSATDGGNFSVPSKIRRGEFLLTISTGEKKSPGFSRFVRRMLEKEFGENFGECLNIISAKREEAKKILPNADARVKFWREVFTDELWKILKSGDVESLKKFFDKVNFQ